MSDEITLTIPRDAEFHRVAHLVLGGLAVRLDLTIENLEDLQLALDAILARTDRRGRDHRSHAPRRRPARDGDRPARLAVLDEIERDGNELWPSTRPRDRLDDGRGRGRDARLGRLTKERRDGTVA